MTDTTDLREELSSSREEADRAWAIVDLQEKRLAALEKVAEAARGVDEVRGHQFDGFHGTSRSPDANGLRSAHSRWDHELYAAMDALRVASSTAEAARSPGSEPVA